MRKKLFEIIEPSKNNNILSSIYDVFMIVVILLSIVPLCFKETNDVLRVVDIASLIVFIIDYLLRWITADYKYQEKSFKSFVRYPFGILAMIDIISILPSISILNNGLKLLRIFRMTRASEFSKHLKCSDIQKASGLLQPF